MSAKIIKNMSQEVAKFEQQIEVAKGIDAVVANVMKNSTSAGFVKAFVKADAITKISQYLDENYMEPIMALQGKRIGFKTDATYKMEVVRDCLIEATLTGVEATGNQFNIIAGNVYITKEGFSYLLSKVPGLWQNFIYDIPKVSGNKTTVEVKIQWKIGYGQKQERILTFVIKVNNGMGDDAILGKAERKAKKWLYYEVTGNDIGDGEAITEDIDHEVVETKELEREGSQEHEETHQEWTGAKEFTEEEKRAFDYLDKASGKEDLAKRIGIVESRLPNLDIRTYKEKL